MILFAWLLLCVLITTGQLANLPQFLPLDRAGSSMSSHQAVLAHTDGSMLLLNTVISSQSLKLQRMSVNESAHSVEARSFSYSLLPVFMMRCRSYRLSAVRQEESCSILAAIYCNSNETLNTGQFAFLSIPADTLDSISVFESDDKIIFGNLPFMRDITLASLSGSAYNYLLTTWSGNTTSSNTRHFFEITFDQTTYAAEPVLIHNSTNNFHFDGEFVTTRNGIYFAPVCPLTAVNCSTLTCSLFDQAQSRYIGGEVLEGIEKSYEVSGSMSNNFRIMVHATPDFMIVAKYNSTRRILQWVYDGLTVVNSSSIEITAGLLIPTNSSQTQSLIYMRQKLFFITSQQIFASNISFIGPDPFKSHASTCSSTVTTQKTSRTSSVTIHTTTRTSSTTTRGISATTVWTSARTSASTSAPLSNKRSTVQTATHSPSSPIIVLTHANVDTTAERLETIETLNSSSTKFQSHLRETLRERLPSGGAFALNGIYLTIAAIGAGVGVAFIALLTACIAYHRRNARKSRDVSQRYARDGSSVYGGQTQMQFASTAMLNGTSISAGNLNTSHAAMQNLTANAQTSTTMMMMNTVISNKQTLSLPGFLMLMPGIDFQIDTKLIGEGGGGSIRTARIVNQAIFSRAGGETCAVKLIKPMGDDEEAIEALRVNFYQEVSITYLFDKSPYFVKLIGFSPEPMAMLMKHYHGSVSQLLQSNNESLVDWLSIAKAVCSDLARGMQEMHQVGIVHNDLKPDNMLLDPTDIDPYHIVICDFGVATIVEDSLMRVTAMKKSKILGASVKYAAPEVLKVLTTSTELPQISDPKACDVYAFAVTAFEIIARMTPWKSSNEKEIINVILSGRRPQFTAEFQALAQKNSTASAMLELIQKCWSSNPRSRLQAPEVVFRLQMMK